MYSRNGAKGLQKFTIFEILQCTVMGKLILGWEAAKNTDCIEKCFKQKLRRIKFPKKKNSV